MVSWITLLVVRAGTRLPGNANQPSRSGMQPGLTPGAHTHSGCCRVPHTRISPLGGVDHGSHALVWALFGPAVV